MGKPPIFKRGASVQSSRFRPSAFEQAAEKVEFAGRFARGVAMNEPTIICPNCKSAVKLTESLAAPLIEAKRLRFEHAIANKEAEIAKREAAISKDKDAIEKAREAIDERVSQKLKAEREKLIAEEAKKARLIFETRQPKQFADVTMADTAWTERGLSASRYYGNRQCAGASTL